MDYVSFSSGKKNEGKSCFLSAQASTDCMHSISEINRQRESVRKMKTVRSEKKTSRKYTISREITVIDMITASRCQLKMRHKARYVSSLQYLKFSFSLYVTNRVNVFLFFPFRKQNEEEVSPVIDTVE